MSSHQHNHSFYSTRAKNLLFHPRFAMKSDEVGLSWRLEYSGGTHYFQTDKILTLQYSHSEDNDLKNIICESICVLSQGKTMSFVTFLAFRELESFLRDENHVRSFAEEVEAHATEIFAQVKTSLLVHALASRIVLPAPWSEQKFLWKSLSLTEKNRAVTVLIDEIAKLFPEGKIMELVLAEEGTVTVKKNDFPLDLPVFEGLMGQLFSNDTPNSPLKVVGTM